MGQDPSVRPILIAVWSAWGFAALAPFVWRAAGIYPNLWPPLVPAPVLSATTRMATDQYSSVGHLLWVVGFALCSCVPLEIAKYRARRPLLYAGLIALEVILVLDILRFAAWDWWLYLLQVLHLFELDHQATSFGWISVRGNWPWASGCAAIIFTGLLALERRSSVRSAGVAARAR